MDWIWPPHLPIAFDLADVALVCGQVLMLALLAARRQVPYAGGGGALMARRTFVSNGITYSDCEPGWLKAHKDDWDIKLTRRGHKMRWRKTGRDSYGGRCAQCGARMLRPLGHSSGWIDIRNRRCGKAGIFRLIMGGG